MNRNIALFLVLFLCIFDVTAKTLKIATLEWPPYACEKCPGGGATIKVLKDFFKESQLDVKFVFYPWSRAIKLAQDGEVDAVWPCWPSDIKEYNLESSSEVFTSPLAFIGKKAQMKKITKLTDFSSYRLGGVIAYSYPGNIDKFLKQAKNVDKYTASDLINIKKLLADRVDFIAIDVVNFNYLIKNELFMTDSGIEVYKESLENLPLVFGSDKKRTNRIYELLKNEGKKNIKPKIEIELKKYL